MRNRTYNVRAEFASGHWGFVDPENPGNRVRFEQALMDATWHGPGAVTGTVRAVHGIAIDQIKYFKHPSVVDLGVTFPHRFGPGMVRLNEDGTVERMVPL